MKIKATTDNSNIKKVLIIGATGLVGQQVWQSLLEQNIQVFISASAIGIYGESGEEILQENSPASNNFLGKR